MQKPGPPWKSNGTPLMTRYNKSVIFCLVPTNYSTSPPYIGHAHTSLRPFLHTQVRQVVMAASYRIHTPRAVCCHMTYHTTALWRRPCPYSPRTQQDIQTPSSHTRRSCPARCGSRSRYQRGGGRPARESHL